VFIFLLLLYVFFRIRYEEKRSKPCIRTENNAIECRRDGFSEKQFTKSYILREINLKKAYLKAGGQRIRKARRFSCRFNFL